MILSLSSNPGFSFQLILRFPTQVTPFLLANFVDASDKKSYKRRIYIDLGIKDFDSSLCWIMQHYPVKFDAMHGFECQTDLTNMAALRDPIDRCISGSGAEKMGYTTEGMMDMLHIYHNYIGLDEDTTTSPQTRGLGQFLQDIGVQEDDFVVLKMDVEGIEFDLLERIMADGTYKLIDEVRRCSREKIEISPCAGKGRSRHDSRIR
jgi:hypothetical protein